MDLSTSLDELHEKEEQLLISNDVAKVRTADYILFYKLLFSGIPKLTYSIQITTEIHVYHDGSFSFSRYSFKGHKFMYGLICHKRKSLKNCLRFADIIKISFIIINLLFKSSSRLAMYALLQSISKCMVMVSWSSKYNKLQESLLYVLMNEVYGHQAIQYLMENVLVLNTGK